jgi:hypothetical protein
MMCATFWPNVRTPSVGLKLNLSAGTDSADWAIQSAAWQSLGDGLRDGALRLE